MKPRLLIVIFVISLGLEVSATTVSTPVQDAVAGIEYAFDRYAKAHAGATATDWNQLKQYVNATVLETWLGKPVEQRIFLPKDPGIADPKREVLVAITVDPVSEDRRETTGRYVVWRKDGRYKATWEKEATVREYLQSRGIALPQGEIYRQPDVLPAMAVHDAAEPMQVRPSVQAAPRSQQPTPTASVPATPVPASTPVAASAPTTPVAQAPAAIVQKRALVWPWLIGIAALLVIVVVALKRCA